MRSTDSIVQLVACGVLSVAIGCASPVPPEGPGWDYFVPAVAERDPWYAKVAEWQQRAQARPLAPLPDVPRVETRHPAWDRPSEAGLDPLPEKLAGFAAVERHALAERIFDWTVRISVFYYRPDRPEEDRPEDGRFLAEEPKDDHWPTYAELVAENGDDCDGLDLTAYRLLRDFGFPENEVYRGILRRNRDRANHMVTLWFEDPADPWVFDGTGAVTLEFRRVSQLPGWTPTTIFNETEQFSVRQASTGPTPMRHARRGAAHD